jgi:MYXO-CTERM domain-containing protein
MFNHRATQLWIAAALVSAPSITFAQESVTDQANRVAEQAQELQQETNELTNAVAEQRAENVATAQNGTAEDRDDRDDRDDDDSGNWGLLGLLGLAGLLGLKRRTDHYDRHVGDRDRGSRL